MKDKASYSASIVFSMVALILLIVNVYLTVAVRAKQTDLGERQAEIASGQTLSQLNQSVVRALAEASVKHNDAHVRDLLASQGITMKTEPTATAVPPVPKAPVEKK